MKKKLIILAALVLAVGLTACTKSGETGAEIETENIAGDKDTAEGIVSEVTDNMQIPNGTMGSNVLHYGDTTYFLFAKGIIAYNESTGQTMRLWENQNRTVSGEMEIGECGTGIIIGNHIYFYDTHDGPNGEYDTQYALACIDVDGSNYRRIDEYGSVYMLAMAVEDDTLCVRGCDEDVCYKINEDGSIDSNRIDLTTIPVYGMLPQDYTASCYWGNGNQELFPIFTAKKCNKLFVQDADYNLVVIDATTGEATTYEGSVRAMDMDAGKMVVVTYEGDNYEPCNTLYDYNTGESKRLTLDTNSSTYIGLYGDKLYLEQLDDVGDANGTKKPVIYAFDTATETLERAYEMKDYQYPIEYLTSNVMYVHIDGDKFYYADARDWKIAPAISNFTDKSVIKIDYTIADTHISDLGTLKERSESYQSSEDPNKEIMTVTSKLLLLDDKYAGASKINAETEEREEAFFADNEQMRADAEEAYRTLPEYFYTYSMDINFDELKYLKNDIICFTNSMYIYTGGAHGIPYIESMTYNLSTGERYALSDIAGIDEKVLKEKVSAAVTALVENDEAEMYWEDAVQTAYEYTSYDASLWYLTDDGITFAFDPYLLAPYAMGFVEVTIPYSELELKLDL